MELAAFAKTYGDFYAPAYAVRLGRDDLERDLFVAISQIEVDMVLGAASRFSFTITNSYSHKLRAFKTGRGDDVLSLLTFGAEIEVCLGYGDAKSMPTAVQGMITEITTNFPDGGAPELSVSGYDHGFPLTVGKNARTWSKVRDSEAVQEIVSFNNLNAKIEQTKEKLAYGEGLLSFKPEANLAGQISQVEVYGWDPKTKRQIVGRASAGEESGLSGQSAGQRLNAFVRDPKKKPTLRLRQPVFTQSEADKRAKAALNERAKQFLTGEGETIGLPDLRPDRNVALEKLGAPFSKTYYIQQATHKIDSSGYRTRFKVKETGL
jgi:hypothetical protein